MLLIHYVFPGDVKTTTSYMWTASKPLECHVIDTYIIDEDLRSVVDCAIKCLGDLYSCVGYVLSTTKDAAVKCEVCWIYDVSDNLIPATNDSNITVYMPVENRQEGGCEDCCNQSFIQPHYSGLFYWHYSISQDICTRFCCALLCCGYAIVHNEFTWSIYPYSSGLLCWHWGNR